MFKTIEDVKAFIDWARTKGIKSASIGDVAFEISDITYAMNVSNQESTPERASEEKDTLKTLMETLETDEKEDEELLYYSSQP